MNDFEKIIEFTFSWEGRGKVHSVAGDPGGTTKWGIAQRYHPDMDVASLTEEKAREIIGRSKTVLAAAHSYFLTLDAEELQGVLETMERCSRR